MSYCNVAARLPEHAAYHEAEYGFPLRSDAGLFERLVLEINQAGLSWSTILRKRDNFRRAFHNFDIDKVAAYGKRDEARLLGDPSIVRNARKVQAAVENARRLVAIRATHGSFATWLDAHHPRSRDQWVRLFKKTFVFTGGEITGEFLLSTGYLPGAHHRGCPVYRQVLRAGPPWAATRRNVRRGPRARAAKA